MIRQYKDKIDNEEVAWKVDNDNIGVNKLYDKKIGVINKNLMGGVGQTAIDQFLQTYQMFQDYMMEISILDEYYA